MPGPAKLLIYTLARLLAGVAAAVLAIAVSAIAAVVGLGLLVAVLLLDLLWTPFCLVLRRPTPEATPRDCSAASIIIVSWNGKHFLERLLPSLFAAIAEHGGDHEVIVVDNGSEDGSVAWLGEKFPTVRVVALPENRYFVRGNMAGVEVATKDIVVFLNNDMVVKPGFLGPLLGGFVDRRVFGVTAEVFFSDPQRRREETGRTRGEFRLGWLKLAHVVPTRDERELDFVPTFWAGGGSSAFDRHSFLALGGFDTLYDPFYLEDTGLSYQAWKRGHLLLFTTRSAVVHEHRGTSRKVFGDDYIDNVIRRNQHLFLWRNITDPTLFGSYCGMMPLQVLSRAGQRPGSLWRGLWFELRALLRALPRVPKAVAGRCQGRLHSRRSDREVLRISRGLWDFRRATGFELGELPRGAEGQVDGLRVLVLCGRLPRRNTDGSWVLFNRLAEMHRHHRVTAFAWIDSEGERAEAEPLWEMGLDLIVEVRPRSSMSGNLHNQVPFRLARDYSSAAMVQSVGRLVEGTDFDLIQVEYIEMAHLMRRALGGLPRVYVCHESLAVYCDREFRGARGIGASLRWGYWWGQSLNHELRVLRAYPQVITLSHSDAEYLQPYLRGRKLLTIPSGVELQSLNGTPEESEPPTITFVGYFRHGPNIDGARWLAREVFPLVRGEIPDACLNLVGKHPPPDIQALDAQDGIRVTGFVPDLMPYLAPAAVVVVPIRLGGGLRGKLLEAWSAGKAVVATRIACEGFLVEDGVHVLLADSPEEFAAQIVRCIRDPELRRSLSECGRRLAVERYSVAATVRAYDAVYRDLLEGER